MTKELEDELIVQKSILDVLMMSFESSDNNIDDTINIIKLLSNRIDTTLKKTPIL